MAGKTPAVSPGIKVVPVPASKCIKNYTPVANCITFKYKGFTFINGPELKRRYISADNISFYEHHCADKSFFIFIEQTKTMFINGDKFEEIRKIVWDTISKRAEVVENERREAEIKARSVEVKEKSPKVKKPKKTVVKKQNNIMPIFEAECYKVLKETMAKINRTGGSVSIRNLTPRGGIVDKEELPITVKILLKEDEDELDRNSAMLVNYRVINQDDADYPEDGNGEPRYVLWFKRLNK